MTYEEELKYIYDEWKKEATEIFGKYKNDEIQLDGLTTQEIKKCEKKHQRKIEKLKIKYGIKDTK